MTYAVWNYETQFKSLFDDEDDVQRYREKPTPLRIVHMANLYNRLPADASRDRRIVLLTLQKLSLSDLMELHDEDLRSTSNSKGDTINEQEAEDAMIDRVIANTTWPDQDPSTETDPEAQAAPPPDEGKTLSVI